jgi:predicted neutral ceramidase superfamily lipid hydrolase
VGLRIGFHRVTPKNLSGEEVGPCGVSSLVFNVNGENHAIIVIDGNNMVIGIRNILVENLRKRFKVSTMEIVTTDTHVLTGLKKADKGYFPVGFNTGVEPLLEACGEALSKALEEASPCGLEVYVGDAKPVRVTGDVFRELENIIEYSEKTIMLLMLLLVLLTSLLAYFF